MNRRNSISRVVVIGGFASNPEVMKEIGRTLVEDLKLFDEFAAFSMYEAFTQIEKLRELARGQTVLTHSAGALILAKLKNYQLKAAHLMAPPFPKPLRGLPKQQRAFAKSPDEHDPNPSRSHMLWYYRRLPEICRADGLAIAKNLTEAGISAHVGAMNQDSYFPLDEKYRVRIAKSGVDVVEISRGGRGAGHSAIQNYPAEVLREYFAKIK